MSVDKQSGLHAGSRPWPRATLRLASALAACQLAVGSALGHEEYVVDDEVEVGVREFFADALGDPAVVVALLFGALAVLVAAAGYLVVRPVRRDIEVFRSTMAGYTEYVPWLLRISFGIPLVGAAFAGYFISPAVPVEARVLQVGLGFLLLFGLATRATALATLVVYLAALAVYPTLLLQFEFVGGMAAIALLGGGKPSADHVLYEVSETTGTLYGRIDVVGDLAERLQARLDPAQRLVPVVVRVGLGATFVALGVGQKLLRPGIALAVVDRYGLTAVVPVAPELWVLGAGLVEAALGLALIAGLFTRAGAATALFMFVLTLFALPDDPVLAHVGLFGMASVLLITGSGPYAVDRWLGARTPERSRRGSPVQS